MKIPFLKVALVLFIFAAGFACGFLFRGAPPEAPEPVTQAPRPENARAPAAQSTRLGGSRNAVAARDDEDRESESKDEDGPRERRSRAELLADLQVALERDDRRAAYRAMEELAEPGQPLTGEEIELLEGLLDSVDGEAIELVSAALVRNGGVAGFEAVMAFASDPEVSLESRRFALQAVARAPAELAERVAPAIADFMESGMPGELQAVAAHALGRLMGERGVDTLLGLLEDRPRVRPDAVFDAIAEIGRGEDTDTLLEVLSGDLDRRSRFRLLRAIGEISGREGDGSALIDLLQNAPDGLSREAIAEAIAESSHRMELSTLRRALELAAGDSNAQASIAAAVARQGGKAGLDILVEAMSDPNIAMDKRTLARALGEYEGPDGHPLRLELIRQSRDGEAIESLAFDIARQGDSTSINELVKMLEGGNDDQRISVAHALRGGSPGSLSLDRLLGALRTEPHPEVSGQLAGSIGSLYGTEGLTRVADIISDSSNVERREALLHGLGQSWEQDPARARELYVRFAGTDPVPELRQQAIEIMQERGDPSLIQPLETLLAEESDPGVRERLSEAISELESRR
jgi:HEAT repeat protein